LRRGLANDEFVVHFQPKINVQSLKLVIVVEITESWVAKNPIDALDVLTRLRMKGFNLSIDDFGTLYSTMLKLKQILFSELKLDQSIIRGAANDEDSRHIVETSIEQGFR